MMKTPSPKITIRKTTALPKNRNEIEALLTREGIERFLNELGRGALEAQVSSEAKDGAAEQQSTDKLALGDTLTVRLPALEFTGLTNLAQMVVASKAPEKVKSMIENSPVFEKVGAGLDVAYGYLRGGLTNPESLTYVDEGVELPKVLKSWRHTHKISESADGGMIVDELEVEVDPAMAAPVIEGALRLHLESRAKAYKKVLDQV
jgi:ligand-binding SRPBCC domain-containing protein/predicted DNA-binding protein